MIIIVLLILSFKPFAAAANPLDRICSTYTATSTYQANLELLSTRLPKDTSSTPTLFARGSVGAAPDTVYGMALCRGDANASDCGSCVAAAFQDAQRLCPLKRDAHVLYETCILHFSGQDFVYRADHALNNSLVAWEKEPGWGPGTTIINGLLYFMAKNAAYNSTTRYATGRIEVGSTFPPLYSTTQCTTDLPRTDCWDCLQKISEEFRERYYTGQQGGLIAVVWCMFRYSTSQFYKGQPMMTFVVPAGAVVPSTNTMAPPSQNHKRRVIKVLVIATVVPLLASLFCFIVFFGLIKRHRKGKVGLQEGEELVWGTGGSSEFTFFSFLQVSDATSNFSDENQLGQGGFGPVYKGKFPDGSEIACKRLASHSGQGFTEFQNEVQLIAKLQHTNLVRLLGCCSQGEEKILIYKYLPNKSLDFFIFDQTKRVLLNWNKSLVIIEGIAQGLLYLHKHSRLRVVHRDLKASNILLDSEMNPKISDFGLAKIFNSNDRDTGGNTKRIAGTYGYMAPEYASEGLFSIKSDIFSFGVLILEIISGKRNSCFHEFGDFFNLLGYAWKLWKEERWLEFVDASIVPEFHAVEMMRCINIALLCVQENAADRPTTSSVVAMLSSESMTLPEPKHPAYFHIRVTEEEPSSVNDVTMSVLHGR